MKKVVPILVGIVVIGIAGYYFALNPTPSEMGEVSAENKENPPESATIAFVGDMMFDRYIRAQNHTSNYAHVLSPQLLRTLRRADLVIGNLEGPITTSPSVTSYDSTKPTHFQFTFDPEIVHLLTEANIRAASIGNNHILNFGPYGLQETTQFLTEAGIGYFGSPYDAGNTWSTTLNDISIVLAVENEFDQISFESLLEQTKSLDRAYDHVIIFAHWGTEYEREATPEQVAKAHRLIDAGADLIIGAHPHVIQNTEIYQGKYIYYSLGNFIFDQYFSDDVRCGLVPSFEFTKTDIILKGEAHTKLIEDGTTVLSEC